MARTRALADLLPWELPVAPGVLRNADGALSTTVSYRGPDPVSSTKDDLLGLTRILVQALRATGDGWIVHFDLHRVPAPNYPDSTAFPDPYTAALDRERREAYRTERAHYVTEQYLTLTRHPGTASDAGLALLRADVRRDDLDAEIEDFSRATDEVLATLATALHLERLDTPDMLGYLYRCLTGRRHPLTVPAHGPFSLEQLWGAGDLWGGTDLRFGDRHIVPIRIAGFPDELAPAAMDFLVDLPLACRFVCRYLPLDQHTSRQVVKRRRGQWNTAGVGIRQAFASLMGHSEPEFSDRYAPAMAADADEALLEIETDQVGMGYLTPVALVTADERGVAETQAARLIKYFRDAGLAAEIERLNALDAYLGALPANGRPNVRRPLFSLNAAARFCVATSVWAGHPHHPHPKLRDHGPTIIAATDGATPFAFSPCVGDVQHTAIIGPTGAGKSVLLNTLLAQYFRYPGAQVFSLDTGYSQLAWCSAAGGSHYDLSADRAATEHQFAPLEHIDSPADLQRANEWLLALLVSAGLELTPALKRTVITALRDLRDSTTRSLATFGLKAQSHEIREALEPYTLDGPYAHLFDGHASTLRTDRLTVVEMQDLLPLRESVVVPLTLHLFDELERRLTGAPTLFSVEELAGYLHRPLVAERVHQYLLQLRKRTAGVVFVAQAVTTILESPLRTPLLESTPTKVYLPNPAAAEASIAEAYRAAGLNDREIELLATATPKRDYYVSSPRGSRLFRLDLSPAALAVLGLAGPTARQTVEEATATWGPRWARPYLEDLGHTHFVELLDQEEPPA